MIEINLLPKEYQRRKFKLSLERTTIYVVAAGFGVLVLLFAYTLFMQVLPTRSLDKRIREARVERQKYDAEIALIKQLKQEKKRIQDRLDTIDMLDRGRDAWVNLLADLGSRVPSYLWLTAFAQVSTQPTQAQGQPQTQGKPQAPGQAQAPSQTVAIGSLPAKIEGKSFTLNSLATMLIRLKQSPFFKDIAIGSIKLEEQHEVEAYTFNIQCNLVFGEEGGITDKGTVVAERPTAVADIEAR